VCGVSLTSSLRRDLLPSVADTSEIALFEVVGPHVRIGTAALFQRSMLPLGRMYKGCTKDVRGTGRQAFRTGFKFEIGSGAGIRTLNLAVNRSVRHVQKWGSEFAECR
jgi:hypothetical protein